MLGTAAAAEAPKHQANTADEEACLQAYLLFQRADTDGRKEAKKILQRVGEDLAQPALDAELVVDLYNKVAQDTKSEHDAFAQTKGAIKRDDEFVQPVADAELVQDTPDELDKDSENEDDTSMQTEGAGERDGRIDDEGEKAEYEACDLRIAITKGQKLMIFKRGRLSQDRVNATTQTGNLMAKETKAAVTVSWRVFGRPTPPSSGLAAVVATGRPHWHVGAASVVVSSFPAFLAIPGVASSCFSARLSYPPNLGRTLNSTYCNAAMRRLGRGESGGSSFDMAISQQGNGSDVNGSG
jgi:hypothetical protein